MRVTQYSAHPRSIGGDAASDQCSSGPPACRIGLPRKCTAHNFRLRLRNRHRQRHELTCCHAHGCSATYVRSRAGCRVRRRDRALCFIRSRTPATLGDPSRWLCVCELGLGREFWSLRMADALRAVRRRGYRSLGLCSGGLSFTWSNSRSSRSMRRSSWPTKGVASLGAARSESRPSRLFSRGPDCCRRLLVLQNRGKVPRIPDHRASTVSDTASRFLDRSAGSDEHGHRQAIAARRRRICATPCRSERLCPASPREAWRQRSDGNAFA
jgi:hypothetical protein